MDQVRRKMFNFLPIIQPKKQDCRKVKVELELLRSIISSIFLSTDLNEQQRPLDMNRQAVALTNPCPAKEICVLNKSLTTAFADENKENVQGSSSVTNEILSALKREQQIEAMESRERSERASKRMDLYDKLLSKF